MDWGGAITDAFHSTLNPWRACSRYNSTLRCRSNSWTMQSREPHCRTARARQLGPNIPLRHSDNRNIRCREPSQSLYMKSLSIPGIRHHSQIRWLLAIGSKSFLFAWFRFRLTRLSNNPLRGRQFTFWGSLDLSAFDDHRIQRDLRGLFLFIAAP